MKIIPSQGGIIVFIGPLEKKLDTDVKIILF